MWSKMITTREFFTVEEVLVLQLDAPLASNVLRPRSMVEEVLVVQLDALLTSDKVDHVLHGRKSALSTA